MNSPMKNDGNQILFNLLNSLLNPNQEIRTNAEQQLNEISVKPGYCPMIVEFALNNQLPDHIRQMASIIAKNFIKKNWEKIDEDYDIIQITDNDKNILRSILPRGLMDPAKKIRSAISMSIASIAHWDWPTLWPNLAEELVKCLSSQNTNLVEGAVECLEMFSSGDNLTSDHIPILVKTAFPALHKLFGTNTATDAMRKSILVIVNSCISWLGVLQSNFISEQNNPKRTVENSKQLVISIVEQWFPFVFVILNQDDKTTKDYTLKIYATNFVMGLMKFFSKSCATQIEKLLGIVWKAFFGSFNLYEQKVVNAKEEDLELNEDGYNTIEAYVCNLVDIVHVMLEKPKYKKVIRKELKMVVGTMMGLSQITNEHINQLMDDPNEFVCNEEDEYVASNSLRISSKEIFIRLLDEFDESISCILSCAQEFNQKATLLFQNGQSHWWKYRECISHTLESVSEYLIEQPKVFNLIDFFNNFVIVDSKSENPFLRMKAFDCAASFAEKEKLNVQMCTYFLEQALVAINNDKESLGVKLFGAKAIYSCAPVLDEQLEKFAAPIIQSLCKLLPLTKQETIHYVLETLNEVMKLSENVVAENYAILLTSFFKLWTSVNLDPESTSQIVESIAIVSSLEVANQMVQQYILPQIIKYFEDEKLDSYIKETAVGLLNAIVRKFKEPLSDNNMLKNCFLSMMKMCLSTDDNSVLQESTFCICNFLINSSEEILFNNNFFNNVSPLKIVFDFVAKFVNPNNNSLDLEEGGLKIGNLLTFLYLRYANKLEGILYQIFKNIVCKLPNSQGSTFKINLLLVLARLAVDNPTNFLNLLAKISSEVQVDAISIVLKTWIENSDTFTNFGMHYNKINVLALAKLFLLNDQRVQSLTVQTFESKDDELNNKISSRTRSKSVKVYQTVPSSEKIFEIIISEYCSFLIDHESKDIPPFKNNLNIDTSNAINPFVENEEDNDNENLDNKEFDDDEDFNEFDDEDDDLQHVLRDAFNEQMDEDADDDPAFDIDPLKDFDLKNFLQGFLSTFTTQNSQLFNLLFSKLPPAVQKKFHKLTTKK